MAAPMVMLEPPELVRVSDSVWLFPTCTLPKLRLAAVAVIDPAVTPVPESGTFNVGFAPSLTIARLPLAGPTFVAVNVTLKVVLCPGAKSTGRLIPLRP